MGASESAHVQNKLFLVADPFTVFILLLEIHSLNGKEASWPYDRNDPLSRTIKMALTSLIVVMKGAAFQNAYNETFQYLQVRQLY